jgi:biopolymer transport protein ExbB
LTDWFVRGGPVMWPLLLLSLLGLTVVVERALFWLRERRREPRAELEAFLASERATAPSQEIFDVAFTLEERRCERGLGCLDTVITAAPLLGILGTVLGIIDSFELLSTRTTADPLAVSGGVAEALITTAAGLIIALVTLFPYNVFRTLVRRRIEDMERAANVLIGERGGARKPHAHDSGRQTA